MGWTETCSVDERMRFVIAAEKQDEPFAAVCRRFGVSRRVGYKWLDAIRKRALRAYGTAHEHHDIIPRRLLRRSPSGALPCAGCIRVGVL